MSELGKITNKALLPINKKAAISHIIENFDRNTRFVIALGYKGELVKSYLQVAHPDIRFDFIHVKNWDGLNSGPGTSLLECKKLLKCPFYFVSCDTLWDPIDSLITNKNWVGVSEVSQLESKNYCHFEINNNTVVKINDKTISDKSTVLAFIGLCFIKDFITFWTGLESANSVHGEIQISSGLTELLKHGELLALNTKWIDIGNLEKYQKAVSIYESYDFSKSDELLYIISGKVIKFFSNSDIADKRVLRAKQSNYFPEINFSENGFYSYEFKAGQTLYKHVTKNIFLGLLNELNNFFWKKKVITQAEVFSVSKSFYFEKTKSRIDLFIKKYGSSEGRLINGKKIDPIEHLISKLNWSTLYQALPVVFHGDLQFDNILYNEEKNRFTLLDWRQDFGGQIEWGDLYYDLGKILGGLLLNYDLIKQNKFNYIETKNEINFSFESREELHELELILKKFCIDNNYDYKKVRIIRSLIYINMAPLHHYPFDKMLMALGRALLQHELENNL